MHYHLTRSARKTVAIAIRNGVVYVRAPFYLPKKNIDQFVFEKLPWINKTVDKQNVQIEERKSFVVDYGGVLIFRGKPYPINPCDGRYAEYDDEALHMPQGLSPLQIKATCVRLYKILAQMHISKRVAFFAKKMKVEPAAIKINSATKRWGSCSSQGSLNFAWRLIMADDAVIDYVVVHELAHILEMNHSTRFWIIVQRMLPDYQQRQNQLKELQTRLNSEDWD